MLGLQMYASTPSYSSFVLFDTGCHHVTQAGLYVDTTGFKLLFLQPLASRVLGSQASTTMPGP